MKTQMRIFGFLLLFAAIACALAFAVTSGPSPIPPPPAFQVSTNVVTLCRGIINNIPIAIRTPSGAAVMVNTQLSVISPRNIYTVGNGTVNVVNVTPNVTTILNMPIFVGLNTSSLVSMTMGINYQYNIFYTDSETRNVSFGIETCPSVLSVGLHPNVLIAGRIENLTINFTNSGTKPLNYLSIKSSLPGVDGTFLGQQPVQISSIAPSKSVSINQQVFVYSNATQSFPINVSVSFYNGSSFEQLAYNPIVLSSGIINITPSSITVSPSKPSAGSIFSLSFVLTDVGTSKASAVTAAALAPSGFSSYGSNSTFVGDMQIDSQTPVTLTLTSRNSLPSGNYTIPVRISYLNNLRQNVSAVFDIPVSIGPSSTTFNALSGNLRFSRSGSSSSFIVIVLAVMVVVLLIVLFLRERHHSRARANK